MYIKSRELLPVDQQVAVEGEEEGEDPRWELIRPARRIQKIQGRCRAIADPRNWNRKYFSARAGKTGVRTDAPRAETGRFDFRPAQRRQWRAATLQKTRRRRARHFRGQMDRRRKNRVHPENISERGSARFAELFESAASRSEVICTFLALLELIRLKQLVCVQPEPFAEIEIRRATVTTVAEPQLRQPANRPPNAGLRAGAKQRRKRRTDFQPVSN